MICPPEKRLELSPIQTRILRTIIDAIVADGVQPSLAELAALLGMSRQNVHYHLREIDRAGWIESRGRARAIVIPPDVRAAMATATVAEIETSAVAEMEVR